jgi:hypothetical protein
MNAYDQTGDTYVEIESDPNLYISAHSHEVEVDMEDRQYLEQKANERKEQERKEPRYSLSSSYRQYLEQKAMNARNKSARNPDPV